MQNVSQKTMVAGSNFSWQGIKSKAVYTGGAGPVCKCMGQCTQEESVQGGDRDLGVQYKPAGIKCKNFPTWGEFCT